MFAIGLTDHLEGPADQPSAEIFADVAELVSLADKLGVRFAWFAEHHQHAHRGHLPTPLLFALHLASQTKQIRLGAAIICLNLHHPLDVAEQAAVADLLSGGRMAVGFGSGSTPQEVELFGLPPEEEAARHARFEEALRSICAGWNNGTFLPGPCANLPGRCWVAVNSIGSARIAGALNFNMLFSHLRTSEQYRKYRSIYREAGGTGLVAANRPVFVGQDDASAWSEAEPALRILWRRFRDEGKIPADVPEPTSAADLCAHPINFIVGGPQSVARQLCQLRQQISFDVLNVELRWAGLTHEQVRASLRRLMEEVMPIVKHLA